MRVLAVDTTSEFGSLALLEDGLTVEETPLHAPDGFSQSIFGYIDALLRRNEWRLQEVDVFAAASGPGSFTGVRVGLTAVKGLADATAKGAVAVSNLKALAEFGTTNARGVLMDARRGQIYAAVYNGSLEPVSPEVVTTFPEWIGAVNPSEIISPDFAAFRPSFQGTIPITEQRTLAAAIGRIAARSTPQDPALLDANYVRRSDAELFWTDRR